MCAFLGSPIQRLAALPGVGIRQSVVPTGRLGCCCCRHCTARALLLLFMLLQVLSNAVLLVDKPARWSSTDVVRQLKSALKYDKICFGAPLDTEATGLLIVLLGMFAAAAG